jgi:hypothetical protein
MKKLLSTIILATILVITLGFSNDKSKELGYEGGTFSTYSISGDPGTGGAGGGGS